MNHFLQFLMPLIYGLCFSPVILSAQHRNNYICYEQNIADTSVLVNKDCKFTLSRSLEKLDVDYFSYLDAKKYEINGPSFSTVVYTIDGQEYKFPSPFIEEIVLVKENIGSVALYALPKSFPNKWLFENFDGKVDTSIRNSCEKIWFSNISQLKAHFDVYAFYVKTNDLEKVIESAEGGVWESFYTKDSATVYVSKYVGDGWIPLGEYFIPNKEKRIPRWISQSFIRECGLVKINRFIKRIKAEGIDPKDTYKTRDFMNKIKAEGRMEEFIEGLKIKEK